MRNPSDEIKRLITAQYNENPGERRNAADALYRTCLRLGIHPSEIDISVNDTLVNDQAEVICYLKRELVRVGRELEYFRRHADREAIKNGAKSGEVNYRWFEVEDLIRERISGTDDEDDLNRGWKTKLMDLLDVNAATIKRWRDGTEQIPEACLEILRGLPMAPPSVLKAKGRCKSRVEPTMPKRRRTSAEMPFGWTKDKFDIAADAFLSGASTEEIADRIGCDPNQAKAIEHGPPKYPFDVHDAGPLSWKEAWQIGGSMFKKSWKKKLFIELGFGLDRYPEPPASIDASPDQIASLRAKYRDWLAEQHRERLEKLERKQRKLGSMNGTAITVYEQIKNAGKEGTTMREIVARLGWSAAEEHSASSRPSELQRVMRIFSIGEHPSRSGGTVWVAAEFKDHYPTEWQLATRTFGRDEAA